MELGYGLIIEQSQKLVMTPELIQAIKILQYNSQELDEFVQEQLLSNPVLEVLEKKAPGEENSGIDDYEDKNSISQKARDEARAEYGVTLSEKPDKSDDYAENDSSREVKIKEEAEKLAGGSDNIADDGMDWRERIRENRRLDDISYRQWEYDDSSENKSYEQYATKGITLPEHLMFQLQFVKQSANMQKLCRYIIESLDENGYMTQTTQEISENTGCSEEKVRKALSVIQSFDPIGVGASTLRECLLIQLGTMDDVSPVAIKMVEEHLDDLAANRLAHIAKTLKVSVKEIQQNLDIIKRLEPKPGRQFAGNDDTKYIVPDILLEKNSGEYVITLNDYNIPHLKVSSYYEKLLTMADTDEQLEKYLSSRVNSAVWLIKSIAQRKQTILNVANAIVKAQKDFFDNGEKSLKSLTLKQIAEEVGIHESTVSRTINGKYMQTPRGVFELKYFFTAGVSDASGDSISSNSVKSFIRDMISGEDPRKPLSDRDMVQMLEDKGISISRRTVAKYREEMNILSSSKRKRF